ncbi:MAG: filamentous hemagglutinin N-terminal domain-containing protein, partial [Gammaproteobacteria bacterium]|nr:filamentous hemagglutinin N-terminal domain-containing protein [Gammaproteobacteria bacterium]
MRIENNFGFNLCRQPSGRKLRRESSKTRFAHAVILANASIQLERLIICLVGITIGMLAATTSFANPDGADVVRGQVDFNHPDASTLNITNSPGAIINWQDFSIQQNEITRFTQDNASSAVLNRVTGQNPSDILGQLLSNGRVFVINPNGIVFGKDAVIDTAGLIASTLDMTDEDFINSNLKFQGENAGAINNMGYIKAGADGDIFLIAPNIENSGIIETEGGEIILAAGQQLTIASLDSDHIVFDVQAPNDEVINLGELITNGGAAKMFAGTIKHSGSINANSISVDEQGRVQIFASKDIDIKADSSITANGSEGGEIRISAESSLHMSEGSHVAATGSEGDGGFISLAGAESIVVTADHSVRALNDVGENGWLYIGHNSEAARTIYNPNTAPDIVGSGFGALPLSFEENQGQTAEEVDFISRGSGYSLFLTPAEAVAALSQPGESTALRLSLVDGNDDPNALGEDIQEGVSNYFIGDDPDAWVTDVANYGKVRYEEVYDGIDLVYYGNKQGELEYDFEVAAGIDPGTVQLNFTGADDARINDLGQLVFQTGSGEIVQKAPLTYQVTDEARVLVPSEYVLEAAENSTDGINVTFNLDPYDTDRKLITAPILVYSTYLGGSAGDTQGGFFFGEESGRLAVDASGNAYRTGTTASADFPTQSAFQGSLATAGDAYVTKLNSSGTGVVFSTYLGGSGGDSAFGIALDSSDNVYITGVTNGGFPTTSGAFDETYNGDASDIFVTKLNADGSSLAYSTYLGSSRIDSAVAIDVDSSGSAYVGGYGQNQNDYPTTSGAYLENQPGIGGPWFLTKLNPAGTALDYSTLLVGVNDVLHRMSDLFVDASGNAHVVGVTLDSSFPTTAGAFDTTYNGGTFGDGLLVKVNSTGSALLYSTFFGGTGTDYISGVSVDGSGIIHVTGLTQSSDLPTVSPFQASAAGSNEAFLAKFDPLQSGASSLTYSSYFGGTGNDRAYDIQLDSVGNIYIAGHAGTGLPLAGAIQDTATGNEAFVSIFDSAGTPFFSTFFGGSGTDIATSIALDSSGDIYIAGRTDSSDLTTSSGAFQETEPGSGDQFITKISGPDVYWNTNSSGDFNTAGNWTTVSTGLTGTLPTFVDDVLISRIGATPTITHSSGTNSVNRFFTDEAFTLSGGTLTLNDLSTINDVFTLSSGTLTIADTTATINNTLNWTNTGAITGSGGSPTLSISSGSTLALSGVSSRVLNTLTLDNAGTL